jgi:hypothetical protein
MQFASYSRRVPQFVTPDFGMLKRVPYASLTGPFTSHIPHRHKGSSPPAQCPLCDPEPDVQLCLQSLHRFPDADFSPRALRLNFQIALHSGGTAKGVFPSHALAVSNRAGLSGLTINDGPHGFAGLLFAYTSCFPKQSPKLCHPELN